MKLQRVLSTKKLDPSLEKLAAEKGIELQQLEFISINYINAQAQQKAVQDILDSPVVFTSKNAVKASAQLLKQYPDTSYLWRIYCLQGATLAAVKEDLPRAAVQLTAEDAKSLAVKLMATEKQAAVYFFCGARRRDDLPDILTQNGYDVKEIVVYETVLTPESVKFPFDGIMFFSPSAVESFFSVNQLTNETVCFSVGDTTSRELKKHTSNLVVTADLASEKSMMDKVIKTIKIAHQ